MSEYNNINERNGYPSLTEPEIFEIHCLDCGEAMPEAFEGDICDECKDAALEEIHEDMYNTSLTEENRDER